MKRYPTRTLLIVAVALSALAGCHGQDTAPQPTESESGAAEAAPTVEAEITPGTQISGESSPPTAEAQPDGSPQTVTFETADGTTLSGTLFGAGDAAIVFSHMYPTEQTSWHPFAQLAADQGYLALAYDFRGFGVSEGEQNIPALDQDVRAAYDYVESRGAQRVVLIGASMGGSASIKAAASPGYDPVGLVVLSSPRSFRGLEVTEAELGALSMPSLWLSARTDMVTPELEALYDLAAGPDKSMWIFEGSGVHGTFLFDAPLDGEDLEQRLLAFLAMAAPVSG